MTPENNRRKYDPRLIALETATRDLQEGMRNREREHTETLTSLSAIHKRQGEVIDENRIGTRVILDEISKVVSVVAVNSNKITKLENNHNWLYGWLIATWTALVGGGTLILQHHDKIKAVK